MCPVKLEQPKMKAYTITHGDDADGLTCAALLKRLRDADAYLANYDNIDEALRKVQPPLDELYVCDLNMRRALLEEVLRIKEFAQVTIIDHHPMEEELKSKLTQAGVKLVYDTKDCAGVLAYDHFKKELGHEAARLAAYAAVSDMFEEGPLASKILARLDRKFAQHEALILTHALAGDLSMNFKRRVIQRLSELAYPHEIEGAVEAAVSHLQEVTRIKKTIPSRAIVLGRLAYMECFDEPSTGAVANLMMDALGVDVGVCYKVNEAHVNISLRGERGLQEHLGEIAKTLAEKHGGFGGGHKRASGAKILSTNLMPFINDLNQILD